MDLKQYIAESSRTYNYRIKTLVPLDDDAMDKIERSLAKYKPLDVARPKKTMLQSHPMDFDTIENVEVYLVDIVTGLPASSYVLQQELRNALNCAEKFIVVRAPNEPVETQGQWIAAEREMDAEAREQDMQRKALLGTAAYEENEQLEGGENFYGALYNTKLLDYLRQSQLSRKSEKFDPPDPLFSWLDMPEGETTQDDSDFNKGIDGVKPASTRPAVSAVKDPGSLTTRSRSQHGNFDDAERTYSHYYLKDKTSKKLSRTVGVKEK